VSILAEAVRFTCGDDILTQVWVNGQCAGKKCRAACAIGVGNQLDGKRAQAMTA
jgi:hypothetical protein